MKRNESFFLSQYLGKRIPTTENVYFYALYDEEDQKAHSGLTAAVNETFVREDIYGNYRDPRYITIHRVPELVGVITGSTVEIMQRGEFNAKLERGEL